MGVENGNKIKCLILCLLISFGFAASLYSQTKISGVINKYGRVTAIGADYVVVDDATQFAQFAAGDTVLLSQMKGVEIYETNASLNGTVINAASGTGKHEFLVVESVEPGTKKIFFRNSISTSFNVASLVQIIKVPSFEYAIVDATLTCQPWDSVSKTGGILAVIVGKTLSLNADINVTAKGFSGGAVTVGYGICAKTNEALWDKYSYPVSGDSSGFKGEGPVSKGYKSGTYPIYPLFARGKGANLTGGGGGNGKYSGGGGGANYGDGGDGGDEMAGCTDPFHVGKGGKKLAFSELDGLLFMGGGGGAGTYATGATPTAGGNGGGMIFIICDTLKGNGKNIIADGESASSASGSASAGGGGGGGTIALSLQKFESVTITANGGDGGDNAGKVGEGGGGGGGLITTDNVVFSNTSVLGGAKGSRNGIPSTTISGYAGETNTDFKPLLTGFLFNSISSSVTGTLTDSICSNVIPPQVNGTQPVGGTTPYTYKWQKSYNLAGSPIDISGSNTMNYAPTAVETDTVWFRRIVTDYSSLSDTSKWFELIVQTAITDNLTGKDTTICYGQDPLSLVPLNSGPKKGNGIYSYQWIQNLNNSDWTGSVNADGISTMPSYNPPALTDTTYFKRIVTSGRCVNFGNVVTVTVLPLITGNIMARSDSVICEGSLFKPVSASAAGGGSNSYKYLWQETTSLSSSWGNAVNTNSNQVYTPDTLEYAISERRYFRRVVYSGPDSVCSNTSAPIEMTRYHHIENNLISEDTTICSGSAPSALEGTTPLKGSGTYAYLWQESADGTTWAAATGAGNTQNYAPPSLTIPMKYNRIVYSGLNDCCIDTSNVVSIKIYDIPPGTITSVTDTTICEGEEVKLSIRFTGKAPWDLVYTDNSSQIAVNKIVAADTTVYTVPVSTASLTSYVYSIYSIIDDNGCAATSLSGTREANVYRIPVPVAGDDKEVCGPGVTLTATPGDGTGRWLYPAQVVDSTENGASVTVKVDSSFNSQSVTYKFYWQETNWQCIAKDSVSVKFYNRVDSIDAGADFDAYSFDGHIKINASALKSWETGIWSVVNGSGTFINSTSSTTDVLGASDDDGVINSYQWTVSNGRCVLSDIVNIKLYDISIPEGFSPNGTDNINETFRIKGLDLRKKLVGTDSVPAYQTAELTIVNGAGAKVYYTSNINGNAWKDWDGTNMKGHELPDGTYYYLLKLTSLTTEKVYPRSGFIILKRYNRK